MQRLPKPEKELKKKIERLEKSLEKAYNESVREKIWEILHSVREILNRPKNITKKAWLFLKKLLTKLELPTP